MKEFFYVFDEFNDEIIRRVKSAAMVAIARKPEDVSHFYNVIQENNHTHCIVLEWNRSLAGLPEDRQWASIPLYIMASKMGEFRDVVPRLGYIRELNARVFFDSDSPSLSQDIQILSSLGIHCGIRFVNGKTNWNIVNDLMHNIIYSKVPRAGLEPFDYILREYREDELTDFNMVLFQNPSKYLHVNRDGKVTLTSEDLDNGNFILESLTDVDKLEDMEAYKAWFTSWQQLFIDNDPCAYCPAWRVCQGKFRDTAKEDNGCRQLFSDVMDAIDFKNEKQNNAQPKELCRP